MNPTSVSPKTFEVRFSSLFVEGRALAFPCDAAGRLDLDHLPRRAPLRGSARCRPSMQIDHPKGTPMSRILPAIVITLASSVCSLATAALPPLDDAAKAKAAEGAARNAWNDKLSAFALCKSQDAVAARYFAQMQQAGKPISPPVATAGCSDPGPFVAPTPPLEAAGAHSPPETAKGPPSSKATATELGGGLKK